MNSVLRLSREEQACEMEENRRGEADGVDPIEHAGVALNERAVILDAAVALDRRHDEAAGEAHYADRQRHAGRFPNLEGSGPPQQRADERLGDT